MSNCHGLIQFTYLEIWPTKRKGWYAIKQRNQNLKERYVYRVYTPCNVQWFQKRKL